MCYYFCVYECYTYKFSTLMKIKNVFNNKVIFLLWKENGQKLKYLFKI